VPAALVALTERLSPSTHEIRARQWLADGWSLGPKCDGPEKQHPCLVLDDQLSEVEKQYEHNRALVQSRKDEQKGQAVRGKGRGRWNAINY
jgi:RyR domain